MADGESGWGIGVSVVSDFKKKFSKLVTGIFWLNEGRS